MPTYPFSTINACISSWIHNIMTVKICYFIFGEEMKPTYHAVSTIFIILPSCCNHSKQSFPSPPYQNHPRSKHRLPHILSWSPFCLECKQHEHYGNSPPLHLSGTIWELGVYLGLSRNMIRYERASRHGHVVIGCYMLLLPRGGGIVERIDEWDWCVAETF